MWSSPDEHVQTIPIQAQNYVVQISGTTLTGEVRVNRKRNMRPPLRKPININAMARKIDVDDRIPLRNYYRIADNILKQTLCLKERAFSKKQLPIVVDELESLKAEVSRQVDGLNKAYATSQPYHINGMESTPYGPEEFSLEWPPVNNKAYFSSNNVQCQTLNEEEIFDLQDKRSLFPLRWIHTHPSQTCFMSSVDLHTHYSYQIMLPEAIAIVMAPTDTSSPHGIFHLSEPAGVNIIRNCQQRGFHPHEEPDDGSPIYEHCSHVYMNESLRCDVIDLR